MITKNHFNLREELDWSFGHQFIYSEMFVVLIRVNSNGELEDVLNKVC